MNEPADYAESGLTIQYAMLEHVRANPNRNARSDYILWSGRAVRTSLRLQVPSTGRFRIEFLSPPRDLAHGVDVKAEKGSILLPGGKAAGLLRTWHDPRDQNVVEYPYDTPAQSLYVWNCYYVPWPAGGVTEERMTGNAAFWIEKEDVQSTIFHCSPGPAATPDFEHLVFRFVICQTLDRVTRRCSLRQTSMLPRSLPSRRSPFRRGR